MTELAHQGNAVATVLYVDDEEMTRKYFERAFGSEYRVLTAPDADSAIGILEEQGSRIGIVVTDYRMPGRDGGDLLRQIAHEFPQIVRMLVTAYADRDVLLDTINSGEVFRVLEKPLDLERIREALRLASELSRVRAARAQRLAAIDETLSFLAHELNTPLAAIVNFAMGVQQRLGDESMPPRLQAEIGKATLAMNDNARYCLSLLSSFVQSIQGAGLASAHHAGNTAGDAIASLLDTYPLSAEQRASIEVEVREDFRITALPNCVALVLSSLLSNALRAVRDQAAPAVRFAVLIDGNPQIRIEDNGPGIAPNIQDRLLVDPVTTHADAGGTGWGMIFCKRIMQSFGGSIQVRCSPGTSITLNFPAT